MSIQFEKSPSTSKRENLVGSRLTPFEKLPRIGSSHEYIPQPPSTLHSTTNPRKKFFIKQEPILIAIKLNDGTRLEKQFFSTNTIGDIIQFIKSQKLNFNQEFYLSSGDVPKRQFKNFNLTLLQANIKTRSMELENSIHQPDFYRKLLNSAKIFLTEVDEQTPTNLNSNNNRCKSSISTENSDINKELKSTRQECHQRLLTCSRKKLRLLSLQEQNDKRHSTFQKFIDNLDEKRCSNIRRYQIELKDYLLKRLEADRLRQQLQLLNNKIDELTEEKKQYSRIIDIVQKAIPLFPTGLLQGSSDGVKSLISRYETLVQTRDYFQQRDFSKEKQERRQKLQQLIVEHNVRIAQLNTRLAQLHYQLNNLQKNQSINEQILINQTDVERLNMTIKTQLESSINSLYDRHHFLHQTKSDSQQTSAQKLKAVQDFILYRIDLVQRSKQLN